MGKPSRLDTMSPDELRAYYKRIRARSEARTPSAFDAGVKALLAKHGIEAPTPLQFVKAARAARFGCRRCAGTGAFITYVENGVPRGPGGECYRCAGRGTQNDHDVKRNEVHDIHYMSRAAAMC